MEIEDNELRNMGGRISTSMVGVFIALAILCALISISVYYIQTVAIERINSDGATYYVIAQEMLNTGQIFPSGWVYVNGDLMSFGKPAVIAGLHFLGIGGYFSYQVATFILLVSASLTTFVILRHLNVRLEFALLGASIPIVPYSAAYMFHVNDIGSYIVRFIHINILLIMIIRLSSKQLGKLGFFATSAIFALLIFWIFVDNPVRYSVYFLSPALGAALVCFEQDTVGKSADSILSTRRLIDSAGTGILLIGACAIATSFFYYNTLEFINVEWHSGAKLAPFKELAVRAAYTLNGLAVLSGIDWASGEKLASVEGAISLGKLIVYPAAILAPIVFTIRSFRDLDTFKLFYCAFSTIGFGVAFVLFSTTTLQVDGLTAIAQTIRYLLPFYLMLLICNFILWGLYPRLLKINLVLAFLLALITASQAALGWRTGVIGESRSTLVNELKARGITRAYAPYWHSHIYTLISDGAVEVRPIEITNSIRPFSALKSERWYEVSESVSPLVFITPHSSETALTNAFSTSCFPAPTEQFLVSGYKVFVFAADPAKRMLGGLYDNASGEVCFGPKSRRQVGEYNQVHKSLKAAAKNGPGFLLFGSIVDVPCGKYAVNFVFSKILQDTDRYIDLGFVDVAAENGRRVLGKSAINGNSGSAYVKFENREHSDLQAEIRVYTKATAGIELKEIRFTTLKSCRK